MDDCQQLLQLSSLSSLDMRDNQIAAPLSIVPFFSQLSTVTSLYLAGNPAVRLVSHYRREMTLKMPALYYLDDKPIFKDDRLIAEAFVRGGKEEEAKVKVELEQKIKGVKAKVDPEAREKRKLAFKQMMGEVAESKSNLVEQHRELKRKFNETRDNNPDKEVYRMKMQHIEDSLKSDKFTRMFDEDMQREVVKSPPISKEFIEDLEHKYRQQKRDL